MKKSSIIPAILFLSGVIVGGAAVFFFIKPHSETGVHISEPVVTEEPGAALQEAEEIPPQGDAGGALEEDSIPPSGE